MAFRAYEDRNLGIDFAIAGARVIYHPTENTTLKAFTGKQKYRFDFREPIIKGINLEHRVIISEQLSLEPGISFVNRTIDQNTMNSIATLISNIPDTSRRFNPTYNAFVGNIYNTMRY